MARQIPYPLKQLRQKYAADAKLLAARNIQKVGVLREQAKIREAKEAEKAANAKRLKTPPLTVFIGNADNSQKQTPNPAIRQSTVAHDTGDTAPKYPTGTPLEDPEIFPKAGETTNKGNTPKADDTEIPQDYTLSDEGEGDNINGNKELRNEGDNEDENNSERAKRSLRLHIAK